MTKSSSSLLKEVEDSACSLEELGEPGVAGHVLGEVGEEDGEAEADLLGGVEEAARELAILDVALVVGVAAQQQELDLVGGVVLQEDKGFAYCQSCNMFGSIFQSCAQSVTTYVMYGRIVDLDENLRRD